MNIDELRIFNALLEDTRELHDRELNLQQESTRGHTAISELGDDTECLTCGHINEAEYSLAENEIPW